MRIEGARRVVDILPLPPDVDLRLRQQARQRSTHHSTKIEGNLLAETVAPHLLVHPERQDIQEQEVRNYWRALEWMEDKMDRQAPVTETLIQELHSIILPAGRGRPRKASAYREDQVGVINGRSGSYEYMAPEPHDVPGLTKALVAWLDSQDGQRMPGPIRAAILAYQFVTIHPFRDGNGRCARALATYELWRSGYWMRGFLSMEEHYTDNLEAYYGNLQMGLPANYYEGHHDPDLTPWLEYFLAIMAQAAEATRLAAESLYRRTQHREPIRDNLSRLQQQLLSRCLTLTTEGRCPLEFKPSEVAEWFGVSSQTARDWLGAWSEAGFVAPASGAKRVTRYCLAPAYDAVVNQAQNDALPQ